MRKNKYMVHLILIGIVLIAALLRLWHFGDVPPSLNWDEVSWGYNTLSMLETGRDEFGKKLPIVIQSFNDYKPALYMYLVAPLAAIFGLSDFVVRLPSAIAGILLVLATYFLVIELFDKRKDLALLSSFLVAVSPWAIQFSRAGFEANVAVLFSVLMILFFLRSFQKNYYLLASSLFAGLAIYTYQSMKVFIPLMLLVLVVVFFERLKKISRKYIFSSFLFGLLIVLPMFFYILNTPESLSRASGTSFLNDPVKVLNLSFYPERGLDDSKRGDLIGQVIDNRRVLYAKAILGNYLIHFDPNFLFVKGDEDIGRHQAPGMGHMYLLELPFFLLGLYFLIFGKFQRNTKRFIFLWLLISPVAASFTWDVPNAVRTLVFLPALQIIVAIGVIQSYLFLENQKMHKLFKYSILSGILVLAIFNFVYFLNQYFVQYKFTNSQDWQYGYEELVNYTESNFNSGDQILVSDNRPMDQSYIFFLYHTRFDPAEYQKNPNKDFKNYKFIDTKNIDLNSLEENQILVIPASQLPIDKKDKVIKTIKFLNGDEAYFIVRN